jgi:hypothetical protein
MEICMNTTDLRTIETVQQLTQEYASYSQSRNGWGKVLGGIAGLIICAFNVLVGPGLLTAVCTIVLTVAWLIGKEMIRKRFYQRFGEAQEVWSSSARRRQMGLVAFVSLIVIGVCVFFISLNGLSLPQGWLYVFFIVAMPWIVWRYLRSHDEFSVGVFLLCACAVTSDGGAYGPAFSWWGGLISLWVALVSLWLLRSGFAEHRQFRLLEVQLEAQLQVRREMEE